MSRAKISLSSKLRNRIRRLQSDDPQVNLLPESNMMCFSNHFATNVMVVDSANILDL